MNKNRTKAGGKAMPIALLFVFFAVVIGGRLIFKNRSEEKLPEAVREKQVQAEKIPNRAPASAESKPSPSAEPQFGTASCVKALQADLNAKGQSHAKGQILVGFKEGISYVNAKEVLAVYGLVVENDADAQATFASRRYVTAAVAPGEEMPKVCMLRNNSSVRYAGLDLYFNLRQ